MTTRHLLIVPSLLGLASVASALACSTHLTALDTRAELDQERACASIAGRSDGGAVQALAESCVCGAQGILRRAGKPFDPTDAGCP